MGVWCFGKVKHFPVKNVCHYCEKRCQNNAPLLPLFRIGLAAAQALGKRGACVVVSSRRQANVERAVALLKSQGIQVTGTTCNVGKGDDREKLIQTASIFILRNHRSRVL